MAAQTETVPLRLLRIHIAVWFCIMQVCGYSCYSINHLSRTVPIRITAYTVMASYVAFLLTAMMFHESDRSLSSPSTAGMLLTCPTFIFPVMQTFCAVRMLCMSETLYDMGHSFLVTFGRRLSGRQIACVTLIGTVGMLSIPGNMVIGDLFSDSRVLGFSVEDFVRKHNGSKLVAYASEIITIGYVSESISVFGFQSVACFLSIVSLMIGLAYGAVTKTLESSEGCKEAVGNLTRCLSDHLQISKLVDDMDRHFSLIHLFVFLETVCYLLVRMEQICENVARGDALDIGLLSAIVWNVALLLVQIVPMVYALESEDEFLFQLKETLFIYELPDTTVNEVRTHLKQFKNIKPRVTIAGMSVNREAAVAIFCTLFGYVLLSAEINDDKSKPGKDRNDTAELVNNIIAIYRNLTHNESGGHFCANGEKSQ